MKIYLATDHAGFELKEKIKTFLLGKNFAVEDCGALVYNQEDDYPDFIVKAAEGVSQNPEENRGIIFGKSGAGEEMVANKFKNVRAVIGFSEENVRFSREDNDANILALGSFFVDTEKAIRLIEIFLNTPFSNQARHVRRIEKIKDIENKNYA